MNNWKWCVQGTDGKTVKGWYNDNGIWYYLNNEGIMQIGWVQDKDQRWYYLDESGRLKTGWIQLKGIWYYLEVSSNGYMGECYVNRSATINGKDYSFDSNGHLIENNANDSLVSDDLVQFIAGWESFYKNAYEDPYYPNDQRYWTIGYGTCYCAIPEAFPNGLDSTCTNEQALSWLKQEINKVAITIKDALGNITLSTQAFETLCDIGYNAGTGSLIGGNTWNSVISGDLTRITNALMGWNKANGIVSNGLTKRCKARVNMCLNGVYDSTH